MKLVHWAHYFACDVVEQLACRKSSRPDHTAACMSAHPLGLHGKKVRNFAHCSNFAKKISRADSGVPLLCLCVLWPPLEAVEGGGCHC